MTFPIVIDRNGGVGDAWRIGGPVEGIPSSYFIDASGRRAGALLRADDGRQRCATNLANYRRGAKKQR